MFNSFVTPWTVAHQAHLSMGFPRQEYWSRLPVPSPRNLPKLEVKSMSPTLQVNCFTTEPWGKLTEQYMRVLIPPHIYPDFILLVCLIIGIFMSEMQSHCIHSFFFVIFDLISLTSISVLLRRRTLPWVSQLRLLHMDYYCIQYG